MNSNELKKIAAAALKEDRAGNDITTRFLIPAGHTSQASIVVKEPAVLCGLDMAKHVFRALDKKIRFKPLYKDGARVKRDTTIASVRGRTRGLLTGERAALNFLGYLSGISTMTDQFVRRTNRKKVKVLDTRKTTPGLRGLEKYAVRCGGGHNHRSDLSEQVLIKDNHRAACAPQWTISQTVRAIRKKTKKTVEIEVDNLSQFKQALESLPDIILLDNMNCAQLKQAVRINKKIPAKRRPLLEASGGITLKNIKSVADTGVDRISVGALTHTHKAIDVSMKLTG